MSVSLGLPLELILGTLVLWLMLALVSVAIPRYPSIARGLFPVGALGGLVLCVAGFMAMGRAPMVCVLPLGLPGLPFHLRLDALSALFMILFGVTTFSISLYTTGYLQREHYPAVARMALQYHVLLASIVLIFLADDAYVFMVAWETMALSSYFLVVTDHHAVAVRKAGFLYLLIEHIGALGILLAFGIMQGPMHHSADAGYTFHAMRAVTLGTGMASAAFFLALLGFGAKAGLLPLHVWLPEAHPVAPSPISALLSGVLLKVGIYGFLRVVFDLLHTQVWWWGVITLVIGLGTALFGAIYSAVQSDMKRLLAYSSIENMGLVITGTGLTILFMSYHMDVLAALALTATLYHCLNHALFKTLLFLGTGSVLHATGERNLGKLGGLIHRMPWVALMMLIGTLAIAGVPPLNGFVSEWLLLQAFLGATIFPHPYLNMAVPLGAAVVALVAGLAAYVMVKFYGVVFLGRPREPRLTQATDAGLWERVALTWLALGCIALGLFPAVIIHVFRPTLTLLIGPIQAYSAMHVNGLLLAPTAATHASYMPIAFFAAICLMVLITFVFVRGLFRRPVRRSAAWNCAYPSLTARMQDTAEGFGQPIRHTFAAFLRVRRLLPIPEDTAPTYSSQVEDRIWYALYLPIAQSLAWATGLVGRLRRRRIAIYLLYSFVTLLILLVFAP
ncbi:MAG: hydrogenase 4 subunit B [Acidiferrobacter sp.]